MEPDVRWHPSSTPATDALAAHAREVRGPGVVTSGRLCPACGSGAHGRPWLRHASTTLHVSLSRSGPHLVTVIADRPVGVDVEAAVVDVPPELVHAPGEDGDLARAWVRKEAILKRRGTGLATPMAEVLLSEESWRDLPSPQGCVAALTVDQRATGE